jgi:biotin carboxyl carrier protein
MEHEFVVDGVPRKVRLEKKGEAYLLRDGQDEVEAEIVRISENEVRVRIGGRSATVWLARGGTRRYVSALGRLFVLGDPAPDADGSSGGDEGRAESGAAIRAPMPGRVIKVNIAEGQEVRKNESLLIVEAMKMENEIHAPGEGVVKKIHVTAGDLVDSEKVLVELEPKKT